MIICDIEGCHKSARHREFETSLFGSFSADLCKQHWKMFKKEMDNTLFKTLGRYEFKGKDVLC